MVSNPTAVRHVVAWLPAVRWSTCVVLWIVFAVAWLFPHLDLPLRAIAHTGLTAAISGTLVAATIRSRQRAPRWLRGLSLAADTALLTGLLDITGRSRFNPFIVMYVTYVWLTVVTISPRVGRSRGGGGSDRLRLAGGGSRFRAGLLEHHRLNDFPTHLFTMWLAGAAVGGAGRALRHARASGARATQSSSSTRRGIGPCGASGWHRSRRSRRAPPMSCRRRSRRLPWPRANWIATPLVLFEPIAIVAALAR